MRLIPPAPGRTYPMNRNWQDLLDSEYGHEPETLAEEEAESAYLNLPAPAAEFVEGYHGCENPHCGCQQPERRQP